MKKIIITLLLLVNTLAYAKDGDKCPPAGATNGFTWVSDGQQYVWDSTKKTCDKVEYSRYDVSPLKYSNSKLQVGLVATLTAIGSNTRTLVFDDVYTISDDITIPSNITVRMSAQAAFNIASGKTLTIGGDIIADTNQQIFQGLGNVSFTKVKSVFPQWFGAVPTGVSADADTNRVAFQKAIDSLSSGNIKVAGDFTLKAAISGNTYILTAKSNVGLIGASPESATIKIADSAGNYKGIYGNDSALTGSISVSGITFDHNAQNNTFATLPEYRAAARASVLVFTPQLTFRDNIVKNSDSIWHVVAGRGTTKNVHVINNKFVDMGYPLTDTTLEHDSSIIYLHGDNINISGNIFTAVTSAISARTAIETHAIKSQMITNNTVIGFTTGANITGVATADSENIIVSNNNFDVLDSGVSVWGVKYLTHTSGYGVVNGKFDNNIVRVRYKSNPTTINIHAPKGITLNASSNLSFKNISIKNNQIHFDYEDTIYGTDLDNSSIAVGYYASSQTVSVENIEIENNLIENAPVSAIRFAGSNLTITNAKIKGNTIINPGQTLTLAPASYRSNIWLAVKDITGRFDIEENSLIDTASTTRIKYAYQLYNAAISGELNILNNKIDLQGATLTAWIRPLYQFDDIQIPYYVEESLYTKIPIKNCKKGSKIRDLSVGKDYILSVDGIDWQYQDYSNGYSWWTQLTEPTGNEVAYQLDYTVDKLTSGNDTGLIINQTDTSSPGGSRVLEIQRNASPVYYVDNTGVTRGASFRAFSGSGTVGLFGMETASASGVHAIIGATTVAKTNTSGANFITAIEPTYNQTSGTSSNTDLYITRTQTAVGSGLQKLIDAKIGTDSKFTVSVGNEASTGAFDNSSGVTPMLFLDSIYNQTGTAGSADIQINRTDTALGSGSQCFIDAKVSNVSKFKITNTGEINAAGISGDGTGKAVCIKADGFLGTCTDAVGVGGTCTCS